VRADEGDPPGPPDHSDVCDEPDAAAGEAHQVDLLGMRADEGELTMPKSRWIVSGRSGLPASVPTMTATVATG